MAALSKKGGLSDPGGLSGWSLGYSDISKTMLRVPLNGLSAGLAGANTNNLVE